MQAIIFTSTSGSSYAEIDSAKVVKIGSTSGIVNLKLNVGATISFRPLAGRLVVKKNIATKSAKRLLATVRR